MFELVADHRDFCQRLIEFLNCPCRTASPDPVGCLDAMGVMIGTEVQLPHQRSRARRPRRRRARVNRGRASEDSDGPDDRSNITRSRRPSCRCG